MWFEYSRYHSARVMIVESVISPKVSGSYPAGNSGHLPSSTSLDGTNEFLTDTRRLEILTRGSPRDHWDLVSIVFKVWLD
jgi:hypothetical protein